MERLITDLRRQDTGELAGVVLENKIDEVKNRINPYVLKFDRWGRPEFECNQDNEYEGLLSFRDEAYKFDYVVWLSPKGGPNNYPEGRLVVGIVKRRVGGLEIECRGIPCFMEREEMVKAANNLGGKFRNPEELRSKAVGMVCWNKEDFWQRCEDFLGMPEVWEAIRNGDDIRLKKEVEQVVVEVRSQIRGNDVWAIAAFELEIIRRGYAFGGGNHGGLVSNMIGLKVGVFEKVYKLAEIGVRVEKVDGKLICPCGEVLKEGQTRCPKCGLRLIE